ncbi:hypothetical protein [Actinomyces ruminis]|uniref:Abi-like protein n=1 Tax=Actinomyces ruminis TaxID=1937003 RepID=A0ABX4MBN7_9ACTO|nr:hypothetical protein [Actinomyces ruminis]PHP52741.1 hypothetical protein BW737_007780 [Actinomyces ruminis]
MSARKDVAHFTLLEVRGEHLGLQCCLDVWKEVQMPGAESIVSALARALRRTWGTPSEQYLHESWQRRLLHATLGRETGQEALLAAARRSLAPIAVHEYSPDALTEATQRLERALQGHDLTELAIQAATNKAAVRAALVEACDHGDTSADGAVDLTQRMTDAALSTLVELLREDPGSLPAVAVAGLGLMGDVHSGQAEIAQRLQHLEGTLVERLADLHRGQQHRDPYPTVLLPLLSESRMRRYRELTDSDEAALRLYQWNIDMSAELYASLHLVEVLMRNSIDMALRPWNASQKGSNGSELWTLAPCLQLHKRLGADLADAEQRVQAAFRRRPRTQRPEHPSHDDMIGQLPFGVWAKLMPRRHRRRGASRWLWRQALHQAFANLDPASEEAPFLLADAVRRLHAVRNRVAHLEPVLSSEEIRGTYRDVRLVLGAMAPEAEEWFISQQRLTQLLRDRRYRTETERTTTDER